MSFFGDTRRAPVGIARSRCLIGEESPSWHAACCRVPGLNHRIARKAHPPHRMRIRFSGREPGGGRLRSGTRVGHASGYARTHRMRDDRRADAGRLPRRHLGRESSRADPTRHAASPVRDCRRLPDVLASRCTREAARHDAQGAGASRGCRRAGHLCGARTVPRRFRRDLRERSRANMAPILA